MKWNIDEMDAEQLKSPEEQWSTFHDQYILRGMPVKLASYNKFNCVSTVASDSVCNRWGSGDSNATWDDIVRCMPHAVMDKVVTVQLARLKEEQEEGDDEKIDASSRIYKRRRLDDCSEALFDSSIGPISAKEIDKYLSDDMLCTERFSNCPTFMGQDDQITTEMPFGRVMSQLYDTSACSRKLFACCIAQEPILSLSEEEESVYAKDVKSIECKTNGTVGYVHHSSTPLSTLSDYNPLHVLADGIVLPSTLLPHDHVKIRNVNFWFTNQISTSNWHYDGNQNILAVVYGEKTIELCPPDPQISGLKPSPISSNLANHPILLRSNNIRAQNLSREMKQANECLRRHRKLIKVQAGDALFIPEGWWHHVHSSGPCLAVNIWFDLRKNSLNSMSTEQNKHMLAFQSREFVSAYFNANYKDATFNYAKRIQDNIQNKIKPCVAIDRVGRYFDTLKYDVGEANKDITCLLDSLFLSLDIRKRCDRDLVLMFLEKSFENISTPRQQIAMFEVIKSMIDYSKFLIVECWNTNESGGSPETMKNVVESFLSRCGDRSHEVVDCLNHGHESFKENIARVMIVDELLFPCIDKIKRQEDKKIRSVHDQLQV